MKRILINGILLLSVLFSPWWVPIFLGIVAVFLMRRFYEIVGWGIFYDLLYSTPDIAVFGFHFFFTLGAIIIFYSVEFAKSKTRFSI